MEEALESLSARITTANSLEELTRPLLEMLELVTGLESTYLTSIDRLNAIQSISIARNSGELLIPEGLEVPWSDTLCKRCLDEGRNVVSNVKDVWGDSRTAAELGIQTYASAPVCGKNGEVIGTLCAAGKSRKKLSSRAHSALNVFSKLISQHLERERLIEELQRSNEYLARFSLTDPLTELPNRKALRDSLGRLLAGASRDGSYVLVGMVDMDGFKQVSERYGHAFGDELIKQCALRLAGAMRETDLLARVGSRAFAFVGPAPVDKTEADRLAGKIAATAAEATSGVYTLRGTRLNYQGVSAGAVAVRFISVDQAIGLAEAAMHAAVGERDGRTLVVQDSSKNFS